jgi:excinuclease UvrABC nuclease subunit
MSTAPFHLPAQLSSGVYHLLDASGAVIYVGQTNNVCLRLSGHPLEVA